MPFPFEVGFEELRSNLDAHVDAVFGCPESDFLVMPRGSGFIDLATFESGYEALKRATGGFREVTPESVAPAVFEHPIALVVLRCILGFTPSEWAYYASRHSEVTVSQGAARGMDRDIRIRPNAELPRNDGLTAVRVRALISAACRILETGVPELPSDCLHRLDKCDTRAGLRSVQALVDLGAPYSVLLYERFLGRPFAGHRDSVSELVGQVVENAVENTLTRAGISFRKTGRSDRLPGFDQAPDFVVPSEFNPQLVIEAQLTEDDGTARDKITRIQHLGALSSEGQQGEQRRFEVVACIAGRGFGVRREDMKKLLLATRGKVFTLEKLDRLVETTRLADFRSCR